MTLYEDFGRSVDFNLPNVSIVEEISERAVEDKVSPCARSESFRIGDHKRFAAAANIVVPAPQLIVDEGA
jgi:hypothetical protein